MSRDYYAEINIPPFLKISYIRKKIIITRKNIDIFKIHNLPIHIALIYIDKLKIIDFPPLVNALQINAHETRS